MAFSLTMEELKEFHSIDRKIFVRLVMGLLLHPHLATKLIALWVWIETMGFPNLMHELLTSTDAVLKFVAGEAIVCLNYMENWHSTLRMPPNYDLVMTSDLFHTMISLEFFHQHRDKALHAIFKLVNGVLGIVFEDIVPNVWQSRYLNEPKAEVFQQYVAGVGEAVNSPHPSHVNPTARPCNDSTVFLTFSQGSSLSKEEITEFFLRFYGDCIHSIHMQEVAPPFQPNHALVVFRTPSLLPLVLDVNLMVKYQMNGKHFWMNKFIPKRGYNAAIVP